MSDVICINNKADLDQKQAYQSGNLSWSIDWLTENLWRPFVKGTGVSELYSTLAGKKRAIKASEADTTAKLLVQAVAGGIGGAVAYAIVGKLAGGIMRG